MNWYKKAQSSYLDIGHDYDLSNTVYLWFIDYDFDFYEQKVDKEVGGHQDWDFCNDHYYTMLAAGRYDKNTDAVSNYAVKFFDYPVKYALKMVHDILRQKYKNPKIYDFDWPR